MFNPSYPRGARYSNVPSPKAEARKAARAVALDAQLDATPGLREALAVPHRIIDDIRERARVYGPLSVAQVNLVLRIARDQAQRQVERDAEVKGVAPLGRVSFQGKIVSSRASDGPWGGVKILVLVTNADGSVYRVWCSAPAGLGSFVDLRGVQVEITATLKHGNEPSFAFGSRPVGRRLDAAVAA